ncbi:MAG: Xaa-Pro peptidase family protein [Planctomycetaceae bacterium]
MSSPNHSARRSKVTRQLKSLSVDAILVSGLANVRYLTGFTGDSSWLLLTGSHAFMLSDTRYETQLAEECADLEVIIRDASRTMNDVIADVCRKAKVSRLAFESDHLSFAQHQTISEHLPSTELTACSGVVETLRAVKDKWELEQTREAIRIAERGIGVVRSTLRPDLTEIQIRYALEAAMRDFGATGPAFEPIIGVGPTGALPHAHAGHRCVGDSPALLIDWGAAVPSGYRSDLTRVFFTAKPTRQMQRVYGTVLQAQQAAIAAIRPGVECRAVDAIARGMIADAGFGKYFGHGLGHGFGLEIHESVRMSPLATQVFEVGMVVTVEPGIYLPGKFGVRIEDDVLVTQDGCEVMSSVPRDFESSIV